MRKKIVAGNWKMNTLPQEGEVLIKEIVESFNTEGVELIVAPPFTHLDGVGKVLKGSDVKMSSQTIAKENFGAYTGEVAAEMVKAFGAEYAIIGHSERRAYYGETNEILNKKTEKALSVGLIPIFCVGENLEERESGSYFDVIKQQIEEGLFNFSETDFSKFILAYEPVWAIGTGKTASPEQAQEIHAFIRSLIEEKYNKNVAESVSILYGGSCKPSNAKELFMQNDIDGGLIGGAALNASDFIAISKSF